MPHATQAVALVPHPATPSAAARSITVQCKRGRDGLALRYVLDADVARVRIPAPRGAARADGLWRHTCFELFVAPAGSSAYREFNFSPSGEWAAYAFARYREGGMPLECQGPRIVVRCARDALELDAAVASLPEGPLQVGLCAVVEEEGGALSYWALRHSPGKPDFHHAAAFALELDAIRH